MAATTATAEITALIEAAIEDMDIASDRRNDYLTAAASAVNNLDVALDRVTGYGAYTGTDVTAVTAHLTSALEDARAVENQTGDYLLAADCAYSSAHLALTAFKALPTP